jgi:hypothetical protein
MFRIIREPNDYATAAARPDDIAQAIRYAVIVNRVVEETVLLAEQELRVRTAL